MPNRAQRHLFLLTLAQFCRTDNRMHRLVIKWGFSGEPSLEQDGRACSVFTFYSYTWYSEGLLLLKKYGARNAHNIFGMKIVYRSRQSIPCSFNQPSPLDYNHRRILWSIRKFRFYPSKSPHFGSPLNEKEKQNKQRLVFWAHSRIK